MTDTQKTLPELYAALDMDVEKKYLEDSDFTFLDELQDKIIEDMIKTPYRELVGD